jgi:uncharacterized protein DUF4406
MRARVYVAGPYSQGNVRDNVRNAYEAANELARRGFAPFVPHATHFWDLMFPKPYEFWLELDRDFVVICDALLRLPGPSNGADQEVALARDRDIPIFFDIPTLSEHFREDI